MTVADVVPAFLAACPSIDAAWQQYLESWSGDCERGHYNDVAVVAHHLVQSYEKANLSEFPAAFALLERFVEEGNEQVNELAVIGLMEDIQNIASHRAFGPSVFFQWLGPRSQVAWDELCKSWQDVEKAKVLSLLDTLPGRSGTSPPDPAQVQDPALRQMIESLYRNGNG